MTKFWIYQVNNLPVTQSRRQNAQETMVIQIAEAICFAQPIHGLIAIKVETDNPAFQDGNAGALALLCVDQASEAIWYEEALPLVRAVQELTFNSVFMRVCAQLDRSLKRINQLTDDSYEFSDLDCTIFNELDDQLDRYINELKQQVALTLERIYQFQKMELV